MILLVNLKTIQFIVHYSLHFLFPAILGLLFFKDHWIKAWVIMMLTNLIDLDHLLAHPVFDPLRCSIGFHILHSYWAIGAYALLFLFPKTRILGTGLLLHIFTDWQDCLWM
jgi:hypothetical protein